MRRVAMLPLENATNTPHVDTVFGDAVATQIRAANRFEVVRVPEPAAQPWLHSVRLEGRLREDMLVAMARQFNADAVLYGSVNELYGYWPPRIGVTLHLISTAEAITLASVDGVRDARHKALAEQAEMYFASQTPDVQLPHNDLVLNSPQLFTAFVANQIARALATPGGVAPGTAAPAGAAQPEELPSP